MARIIHLSDLHFGQDGQNDVWLEVTKHLQGERPDLILITGDIVDTPGEGFEKSARSALDRLDIPFYVCAGNHDRHWRGNRFMGYFRRSAATTFDAAFGDRVPPCTSTPVVECLPRGAAHQWRIGFVSLDSAVHADSFARGYLEPSNLLKLSALQATPPKDIDLLFMLVHHHPLPVRALEEARKASLASLLNVTSLVNSGCFLERLTDARIDLVLHGHEHEPNWAAYKSLQSGNGIVGIIGAGSATGASLTRCDIRTASFNVIHIDDDGSLRAEVVRYREGKWTPSDAVQVLRPTLARRSQMLHSRPGIKIALDSEVSKYVEFSSDRDIRIAWNFSKWLLSDAQYQQRVVNSTGVPVEAAARMRLCDTDSSHDVAMNVHALEGGAFLLEAQTPQDCLSTKRELKPVDARLSFRWAGGGLLTKQEMDAHATVRRGRQGLLRRDGWEFSVLRIDSPVRSGQLMVHVADEFSPADVEVHCYGVNDERAPGEERELARRVQELTGGRYLLTVPYPRLGRRYAVAWRPRDIDPGLGGSELKALRAKARALFDELREASQLDDDSRFGLYLKIDGECAVRLEHQDGGKRAELKLTERVDLVGDPTAIAQAFWGVPNTVFRPLDKDDKICVLLGSAVDEVAYITIPLHVRLSALRRVPAGVLRIGICSPDVTERLREESFHAELFRICNEEVSRALRLSKG